MKLRHKKRTNGDQQKSVSATWKLKEIATADEIEFTGFFFSVASFIVEIWLNAKFTSSKSKWTFLLPFVSFWKLYAFLALRFSALVRCVIAKKKKTNIFGGNESELTSCGRARFTFRNRLKLLRHFFSFFDLRNFFVCLCHRRCCLLGALLLVLTKRI